MSIQTDATDVTSALIILRDFLEEDEQQIRDEGIDAMKVGEYDTAASVIEFGKKILVFRQEVEAMVEKWKNLEEIREGFAKQPPHYVGLTTPSHRESIFSVSHRTRVRQADLQTTDYCKRILEVLNAEGGVMAGQEVSAVVNKRVAMMYPKFKTARHLMAANGWTTASSTSQRLEISAAGRQWLAHQDDGEAIPVPEPSAAADIYYQKNGSDVLSSVEDLDDIQI